MRAGAWLLFAVGVCALGPAGGCKSRQPPKRRGSASAPPPRQRASAQQRRCTERVVATARALLCGGEQLAEVKALDAATKDWTIAPLRSRLARRAAGPPKCRAASRTLSLCAAPRTTFRLLKRVICTARQLRFDRLLLGVSARAASGAARCRAMITVVPPYAMRAYWERWPPAMRVIIVLAVRAKDYRLTAGGDQLVDTELAPIGRALRTIRQRLPHKKRLLVSAEDGVPLARLVQAMRLAGGAGFSQLSLSDAARLLSRPLQHKALAARCPGSLDRAAAP